MFFALGNDHNYSQVIAEITKEKEGIAVARDTLLTISQNADERARFRSRRIWLQDREHEQAVARKEGRKEGREEGRKEGHAEGRKEGRAEGRKEVHAEYEPLIATKDAEIATKDAEIANMAAEIAALRAKLSEGQ